MQTKEKTQNRQFNPELRPNSDYEDHEPAHIEAGTASAPEAETHSEPTQRIGTLCYIRSAPQYRYTMSVGNDSVKPRDEQRSTQPTNGCDRRNGLQLPGRGEI